MRVTDKQANAINKILKEYEDFAKETGDRFQLAEDADTYFAISNVQVLKTCVKFTTEYSGFGRKVYNEVVRDSDELDEWIKWLRACLRRAKRYFATDPEILDRMADGTQEDDTDQDNE